MTLLDETLELARGTHLPVTQICRGADVTTRWFYMFVAGELKDPSVRRVQRLHDYLRRPAVTPPSNTPEPPSQEEAANG